MQSLPLLLGHRGCRGSSIPENTVAAFDFAARCCDGFEFDVRLTADERALICHDERVRRVSVSRANETQLRNLPVLSDVIQNYGQRSFLDVELKVAGLESHLLEAIRNFPPIHGFVVSSFLPAVLIELSARRDGISLGLIADTKSQLRRWASLPIDWVMLEQKLVNEKLLEEMHAARRRVMIWTVNQPAAMRRFAEMGADALISDDPKLLVKTLRGKAT